MVPILSYRCEDQDAPNTMKWAAAMVPILKPGKKAKDKDP